MNIKEFSRETSITVYATQCSKCFPKEELKPITSVEWLLTKNIYRGFGLYDNDTLLGCAFLVQPKDQKIVLLDYFAIWEEHRSLGIGGQFLSLLTEIMSDMEGVFIETENPHFAKTEDDMDLQTRRIGFYTRNGAVKTPLLATLFNVHHRILFLPIKKNEKTIPTADTYYQQLDTIYVQMIPEKYYQTNVEIEILAR